jgi:hypothetical protein
MNASPHLATSPRLETCTAQTVWDGEAAVLRATFEYDPPAPPTPPTTLRERLDEESGLQARSPRLMLGDIEIAYRDGRRLESIELRTTPSTWQREPIDDVLADAPPVWITFKVEYDDNAILSLDLPVSIRWDAAADRLALVFAPQAALHWHRIADSVAVGTSADGALAELRFSDVEIQAVRDGGGE